MGVDFVLVMCGVSMFSIVHAFVCHQFSLLKRQYEVSPVVCPAQLHHRVVGLSLSPSLKP